MKWKRLLKPLKIIYWFGYSFYVMFHEIYADLASWNVDEEIKELKELNEFLKEKQSA